MGGDHGRSDRRTAQLEVLAGDASELIKIAEAFHENKLAQVAGCVAEANRERGVRLVLISGPSSSGKTTFAKRLGVQLRSWDSTRY